ncbi:MAG: hypothetical protein GTO63_28210 [Anaerolineae bacterium]|nr:hypothetical protein [Anaerolineae bacterium]NIQ81508.1 hypothetical protein [Anaerolineae bacterium]
MMSRLEGVEAARESLRTLARMMKATHQVLSQSVHHPRQPLTQERQRQLSDTLEHMGEVREGFVLSQRMPLPLELGELRELIQHVLLNWGWVEDMGLLMTPGDQVELVKDQIIAYQHALVAMGVLPRLPAEAVTFPQSPPTYADLSVPGSPGELLERIEEIEHVVYRASVIPLDELAIDPLRRTYAFFEASSWLVTHYLPPVLTD